jgi:hypothetical protein
MKKNLEWYRHEVNSNNHWKFKMLRVLYQKEFGVDGWAGEGRFWALNNEIAKSELCQLSLSDEIKKLSIAADLGFTPDQFDTFLNILIKQCKLVKKTPQGLLITDHTQTSFSVIQEDREYFREKKREYRDQRKKTPPVQVESSDTIHFPTGHSKSPIGQKKSTGLDKTHTNTNTSTNTNTRDTSYEVSPRGDADLEEKIEGVVGVVSGDEKTAADFAKSRVGKKKSAPKKISGEKEKLFNDMKNSWMVWMRGQMKQSPKFDSVQASGLSKLRTYFLGIAKEQGAGDEYEYALQIFTEILNRWEELAPENFLYAGINLTNINQNINRIINFLNNGSKANLRNNSKGGEQSASDARIEKIRTFTIPSRENLRGSDNSR